MNDNSNKKGKIIEKYNSTAHFYDARYSKIQDEKFSHVLKNHTLEGKIILDAGCGTGLFHEYIQKNLKLNKNPFFFFLAVDISFNMLTSFLSKIKNGKIKCKENIILILSDIGNLPFRNNVFDSIFSLTSLQNLPIISEGVRESFRVGKNEAKMRLSILKKSLDLDALISSLKSEVENLKVLNLEKLEDIILCFNLRKKRQ
ncbi:MAG: class I SAM-dependent methyltransferase [Promethearchaeota archaeon]